MTKKIKKIRNGLIALICAVTIIPITGSDFTSNNNTLTSYATVVNTTTTINGINYNMKWLSGYPTTSTQTGHYNCWQFAIRSMTVYKYNYSPTVNEYFGLGGNYYMSTGNQPFNPSYPNSNPDPNVLDVTLTEDASRFFVANYFGSATTLLHRRLTYSEIKNSIDNDKPILMKMSKTSGTGGHDMVMIGYVYDNNNSIKYLKCYDPSIGGTVNIATTGAATGDIITYTRSDGVTFKWAKTITI